MLLAAILATAVAAFAPVLPPSVECVADVAAVDTTYEVQQAVRRAQGDCPFAARVKLPACEIVVVNDPEVAP